MFRRSKRKEKFFPFLEYHFYIFSRDGEYVISNISIDYKGLSLINYQGQIKLIIVIL